MERDILIEVRDTGIGIPQADLPRIFERFYKSDRSRHRDQASGTGLGLSIAKHIIQAHGGRIWASSREGKGSSFYMTLPAYTAEPVEESTDDNLRSSYRLHQSSAPSSPSPAAGSEEQ